MDRDAELYCFTSISDIANDGTPRDVGLFTTKHSILVKHTDIYEMGQLVAHNTLFGDKPNDSENPEIKVIEG